MNSFNGLEEGTDFHEKCQKEKAEIPDGKKVEKGRKYRNCIASIKNNNNLKRPQ